MSEKEFRMYMVKWISNVKDDVRTEIRDKTQEIKDHFDIEILKSNQAEILIMKG